MTRSRRAEHHGAWLLALGVAAAGACGGRSLSLGGDPLALSVGSTAGAAFAGGAGGTEPTGAAGSQGGAGGVILLPIGGAGGAGGAGIDAGGMGGAGENAYPPVAWENGQGYRDVCPEHDDTSGFTCWHHESNTGTTCALDGSPDCNACSCAIPCDEPSDCPLGPLDEPAGCFGSENNVRSCFLTCEGGDCPLGMECSTYPGTASRVCMWVGPSRSGMGVPK